MQTPTVDVLIFVEHVARELETACLVSHYLEQDHGLSVRIASYPYENISLIARLAPRVVCLPNCRSRKTMSVNYWWDNVALVNLAWEQILSNANKQANAPREPFLQQKVHYLAWGNGHQTYLQQYGVPLHNITITGSPNFGLLSERYRFLSRDREVLARNHHLDPERRWVFIPENFGWAFMPDAAIEERVTGGLYAKDKALAFRDFQQRSLREFIKWLRAANLLSDVHFILRPRPANPVSFLRDAFDGDIPANVALIKDGTAREWLLASDLVISNYSTVLVDAAVAGKPIFNVRPEPIPELFHAPFLDHVPVLESQQMFLEVCSKDDPGSLESDTLLNDYALQHFHREGDPFERMAGAIAALRQAAGEPKNLFGRGWYRWDRSWKRFIPFGVRVALSRMCMGTRLPDPPFSPERPPQAYHGDWLDVKAVAELKQRIRANLGKSPCYLSAHPLLPA